MNLYRTCRFSRPVYFSVRVAGLDRDGGAITRYVRIEARRARAAQHVAADIFGGQAHTQGVDVPTSRGLVFRDAR